MSAFKNATFYYNISAINNSLQFLNNNNKNSICSPYCFISLDYKYAYVCVCSTRVILLCWILFLLFFIFSLFCCNFVSKHVHSFNVLCTLFSFRSFLKLHFVVIVIILLLLLFIVLH